VRERVAHFLHFGHADEAVRHWVLRGDELEVSDRRQQLHLAETLGQ
jgi:hypothetical protein